MLLAIIYIAFISLGLPDSVLGAAWPSMHKTLDVPLSFAGILSMTCCSGTVISSLLFSFLSKRFKTHTIVTFSTFLTAIALFGYSKINNFYMLIPIALILGLGAGSIDSALNNYVAMHYKARQMSFLHASWGIGTTVGPFILAYAFSHNMTWDFGYKAIASIQSIICLILLFSSPLWNKAREVEVENSNDEKANISYRDALKRRGAPFALIGFFGYCSMENIAMLWSSAYSVSRGLDEASAATAAGLLFWGITTGRILSGIVSDKLGDKKMIRLGLCIILVAILSLAILGVKSIYISLFILGIGFGPIYPSMIHQTPFLYGKNASATLMGLEMASAYVGSTFMPSIFGLISSRSSILIMPFFMLAFLLIVTISTELKRGGK